MNGLEELKKIEDSYREQKGKLLNDPFIHLHEHMWFVAVEKELKDYHEIKEIAEHYHFNDLARDTHMTTTDEKYLRLFNAAIPDIQADYRKARAFDIIKKKSSLDFDYIRNSKNYDEYLKHFGKVIQEMLRSGESVHFAVNQEEFYSLKEELK